MYTNGDLVRLDDSDSCLTPTGEGMDRFLYYTLVGHGLCTYTLWFGPIWGVFDRDIGAPARGYRSRRHEEGQ